MRVRERLGALASKGHVEGHKKRQWLDCQGAHGTEPYYRQRGSQADQRGQTARAQPQRTSISGTIMRTPMPPPGAALPNVRDMMHWEGAV